MKIMTETQKAVILLRNKRALTEANRKRRKHRHLYEDQQLARELGLTIEEVRGENDTDGTPEGR